MAPSFTSDIGGDCTSSFQWGVDFSLMQLANSCKGEKSVQEIRVLVMLTTFNIKERNKNPVSHNSPLFMTPPFNSVPTPCWNLDWLDLAWAARGAVNPCVQWPRHIPKELFHFPISRLYRPSVPLPNGPRALAREA